MNTLTFTVDDAKLPELLKRIQEFYEKRGKVFVGFATEPEEIPTLRESQSNTQSS